jgi:phage tail-like protein
VAEAPPELALQSFRFQITLVRSPPLPGAPPSPAAEDPGTRQLGDGGFQECGGLEMEADLRDYQEGGRNDRIVRRVGRVKLQPIVLKRGMFAATPQKPANAPGAGPGGSGVVPDLWLWFQGMIAGTPIPRYDGIVEVRGPTGTEARATWRFSRGLPLKVVGPALNARTGEIAVEELHIAHERLWLEAR